MVEFNDKFEEQIQKYINDNAYTDRRIAGSIIGLGLFGGLGFLIFTGTVTFGVCGSTLAHTLCNRCVGRGAGGSNWEQDPEEDRLEEAQLRPVPLLQDPTDRQVDQDKPEEARPTLVRYPHRKGALYLLFIILDHYRHEDPSRILGQAESAASISAVI